MENNVLTRIRTYKPSLTYNRLTQTKQESTQKGLKVCNKKATLVICMRLNNVST